MSHDICVIFGALCLLVAMIGFATIEGNRSAFMDGFRIGAAAALMFVAGALMFGNFA